MDAWIDCFSDLRDEYGMTCFKLADDEVLHIELHHVADLNERLPEIVAELVKCTALVNARYVDWEQSPAISLVRVG